MVGVVPAPIDWVEEVSQLKLPPATDRRLQDLMDRNNEGKLSADERNELAALAEMSERLSLVRAHAQKLLNRNLP